MTLVGDTAGNAARSSETSPQIQRAVTMAVLIDIWSGEHAGADDVCVGFPRAVGIPAGAEVIAVAVPVGCQPRQQDVGELGVRVEFPALLCGHHGREASGIINAFF